MRPLILEYVEKVNGKSLDYSLVEYSKEQNLSVLKNTNTPAVKFMPLDTDIITKAEGTDRSDPDTPMSLYQELKMLLDTSTQTLTNTEISDSDNQIKSLSSLLDTQTITESVENSDSDK